MSSEPRRSFARIYSEPYDVEAKLRESFGFGRAPFEQAVRAADVERRRTTHDDADGAEGYYLWTRALRVLRVEARRDHGWHRGTFLNIPVVFNEDESSAIAVSSGDARTGRIGDDPSTKNIKGPAAALAVEGNHQLRYNDYRPFDDEPVDFYYLLIHSAEESMWAEVSRPTFRDASGRISSWSDRVLLGEIHPDGGTPQRKHTPGVPDASIDLDVPVLRKKRTS